MSAPISTKAVASGKGAAVGVGVSATIVELLGQLHTFQDADPRIAKALGAFIVLLVGMFGAQVGAWLKKESDDFLSYAVHESGKVIVTAEHAGLMTQTQGNQIDAKIAAAMAEANAKAQQLLSQYLPSTAAPPASVSTGVLATSPPDEVTPPAPVVTQDPVLSDDAPVTKETDPVLQD